MSDENAFKGNWGKVGQVVVELRPVVADRNSETMLLNFPVWGFLKINKCFYLESDGEAAP